LQQIIPALASVVYSTRAHKPSDGKPYGVLVYLRTAEGSDALTWVDKDGNGVTGSQFEILKATRQNFPFWLAGGVILRDWARCASGNTAEGISWIEDGIRDYRATGSMLRLPYFLALKAEALHLADRTSEALEAISEAAQRSEERWWCAELHRLHGVLLTTMGADEAQVEASFS
jgi:predicted ATPase